MGKIEVKCFALNDFAQGVFKIGKQNEYASNLLPKEVANVDKGKNGKYYVSSYLKKSESRVDPKCELYNKCGGCHILHMNKEAQKEFKLDYVTTALKDYKINPKIDRYLEAEISEGYRNKMQVAYSYKDGKIVYGFYEEESHRIIPMKSCLVQTKRQNEIVRVCAEIMQNMRIQPYNEDKRIGLVRFIMIREAFKTGEVLVTIVTSSEIFPGRSEFVKRLKQKCPYITSIVQNINKRKTSIILGDDERVLYGPGYIKDVLCGIEFKISSKTFYQINPYQTEKLYNVVKEYAALTGNEYVLDAYCGVGTIGMTLAKDAKRVIGVENNKQSVINARLNASDNKIKNMSFVCDDATAYMKNLKDEFDVLIMDPPRSGSTDDFLSVVNNSNIKKVVYVSCEAKTLARDLSKLTNYRIVNKTIVDMFVGTYHVETVVSMVRKEK